MGKMGKNLLLGAEAPLFLSWDKPEVLLLLLGLIPLIILEAYHYRTKRPFLRRIRDAAPQKDRAFFLKDLGFRYRCSFCCFALGLSCAVAALAGPRWGRRFVMEYRRGVDVMLAFDVSRSMAVRDGAPHNGKTRLEQATENALLLVAASPGIRFGAAVGAGRGSLAVPLTRDGETIRGFLESLSPSVTAGKDGTNLELLLTAAARGFKNTLRTKRCMVVFSDGESWSGSLSNALETLKASEITVVAIGAGTESGGPVPLEKGQGDGGADRESAPVSRLREETLRNIAERTGGLYMDPRREDAPKALAAYINALSPPAGVKGYTVEARARWRLFALISLAGFGTAKALGKRRRRRG